MQPHANNNADTDARHKDRPTTVSHDNDDPSTARTDLFTHAVTDQEVSGPELLLTRRHFLYGALGVGVLAVAASTTASKKPAFADTEDDLNYLSVSEDSVLTQNDFTETPAENCVSLIGDFKLPYGTLLWTSNDSLAACLLPTESSKPLTKVGVLFFSSGTYNTVLEAGVGQAEGFEIYDVRASSLGLIWTEANILSGIWRIYTATFDGNAIGTPIKIDEGDAGWETPTIAAVNDKAFWQVLPALDGDHRSEDSLLKRAVFGEESSDIIYSSQGRMSTPPYPLSDGLVITPRTNTNEVHHQLTLLDSAQEETVDALALPLNMKPLEAGYGTTGFTFSFDGIYDYGGGIANMGTYTPTETHDAYDYGGKTWFRFERDPSAPPSWCKNLFVVKSTRSVCGINFSDKTYFALGAESGSASYGDYLASTGINETFVTYSNVHHTSIEGEESKYCRVRVWAPLS